MNTQQSTSKILQALGLTLMIGFFGNISVAQETPKIQDWDSSIPAAELGIIGLIQAKAIQDYYTDKDGVACGGEVAQFTMSDYYTSEDVHGDLVFLVKVKFFVTGTSNACKNEVLKECEAPITIYNKDNFVMGKWSCTVVDRI